MKTAKKKVAILACLNAFLFIAPIGSAQPKRSGSPATRDAEQKALTDAQIEAQKAQAEYYRLQTQKLAETPSPSPTPEPKALVVRIAENPANWLGVLGAIIAAIVALVSFIFNYRATIQNQRDTQFYEALKRFGDKDSPTIRASAAGLLAQLGPKKSFLKAGRPYLGTAVDQLVTGLLLEDDRVVLGAIGNALKDMTPRARQLTADKLYNANRHLQSDLALAIAAFAVANGSKTAGAVTDNLWMQAEAMTGFEGSVIRKLTSEPERKFEESFSRFRQNKQAGFTQNQQAPAGVQKTRLPADSEEGAPTAEDQLVKIGNRLQVAIGVSAEVLSDFLTPMAFVFSGLDVGLPGKQARIKLRTVLLAYYRMFRSPSSAVNMFRAANLQIKLRRRMPKADPDYIAEKARVVTNYNHIFLPKAFLKYAHISMLTLKHAQLQSANLSESRLSHVRLQDSNLTNCDLSSSTIKYVDFTDACLMKADLRDTQLKGVVVKNARLGGALVDGDTTLVDTEWWMANFFLEGRGDDVDTALMSMLSAIHPIPPSTLRENLHESVRLLIERDQEFSQQVLARAPDGST